MTTSSLIIFFFSSRRRHTRFKCDWSSDVCSSDLPKLYAEFSAHPASCANFSKFLCERLAAPCRKTRIVARLSARSEMLEAGGTLVDEGVHAFLLVLRGGKRRGKAALRADAVGHRGVECTRR